MRLGHGMQVVIQSGSQAAGPARAADIKVQSGFEDDTAQRAYDRVKPVCQFQAQHIGAGIRGNVCYWRHGFEYARRGR